MSEALPDPKAADQVFQQPEPLLDSPGVKKAQRDAHFRWGWGLGILIVGIIAEVAVWNAFSPDRTYQVMYSLPIVSGVPFFLAIWWVFASGVDWMTRFLGVLAVASVCGVFLAKYRFEGFEGDMIPRFRSRTEPTAEQNLSRFLEKQAAASSKVEEDVSEAGEVSDANAKVEPVWKVEPGQGWFQYRGARRDGIVRTAPEGVDWSVTPEEVWRHPVGTGWSSFAIVEACLEETPAGEGPEAACRSIAITQEQREEDECVVAYDAETGNQLWVHSDGIRFEEALGGPGPRATPTIDGVRVYSLGATGQLNCVNTLTGALVWSTNILEDANAKNLNWAMSGSPLVAGNRVIVNPGGADGNSVVAYDKLTGERIWAAGNDPASYTAPVLATLLGKPQVLVFGGLGPVGHDLETGQVLWSFPWENQPKVNASVPVLIDESSVMIGSGYGLGSVRLRLSADGDMWNVTTDWDSKRLKLKFNAPVRQGDYVYGLDEGILTCIDLKTGKPEWKRGRYGYGQLLLCGDVLIVQGEKGEVAFVEASPEKHNELHRFEALTSKTWNHPVVFNGHLFTRNGEEAVCFRLK